MTRSDLFPRRRRVFAAAGGRFIFPTLTVSMALLAVLCMTNVAKAGGPGSNPICNRIASHAIQASTGAQMYCFGPQLNGPGPLFEHRLLGFGSNVDAANPAEDIAPNGVRAYGQSETSIAAIGPYVVEAWNDSTGFFSVCPAPLHKEEISGLGFSNDGGKTFHDLGGLPNPLCTVSVLAGDPSVEAYQKNGKTYFYIGSLYIPFTVPQTFIGLTVCTVASGGTSLSCGNPIVAAVSSDCATISGSTFCSFLDKDFFAIDPQRGRLYVSYTEFGPTPTGPTFKGQVELAACDIGTDPANPKCHNGNSGAIAPPYLVVGKGDDSCESEGSYPAVSAATGSVYVAWEFNWASNVFGPLPCFRQRTQERVAFIPHSCLTIPSASCSQPARIEAVNVASLDAAFIPGYNRFPMNDFPRIAVSDPSGTVSIVWNDARYHPAGDILMQSFNATSLTPVQSQPVRLNSSVGGWHFLPAVRQAGLTGNLNVSFYGRSTGNTALTDVLAALNVNPRTTVPPATNQFVTTGPTDWFAVSSDIVPNFGDYTDNYLLRVNPSQFDQLFVAWSDGRLGDPQPFEWHN